MIYHRMDIAMIRSRRTHNLAGLTLVEISIVFVIIGLIASGVAIASNMRWNTKMQSLLMDKGRVVAAIASYKTMYNAIPGDHSTAESVFGASATDNGNDDGNINIPSVNTEIWLVWQHLALAGLWKGVFTGVAGPTGPVAVWDAVIGTNVPKSPFDDVGYSFYYSSAGGTGYGASPQKHFLVVGKDKGFTDNTSTYGGWISPSDIKALDNKVDDGLAISGNVRTYVATANYNTANCTTGVAPAHVYNTANTTALCNLLFMFDPNEK